MRILLLMAIVFPAPALAEMIVAARTIRAHAVISAQDLAIKRGDVAGVAVDPSEVMGLEARVTLYAGRPVRLTDVGPPAVIDRNEIVPLIFEQNGLRITTEGRSMSRAGAGEQVRVMNLSSRTTVTGRVEPDGNVIVSD